MRISLIHYGVCGDTCKGTIRLYARVQRQLQEAKRRSATPNTYAMYSIE